MRLEEAAGLPPLPPPSSPTPHSITKIPADRIQARFDAFFHGSYHQQASRALAECAVPLNRVDEIAKSVVEPGRFKRIPVDDPKYGVPFFGTAALMWSEPARSYFLSRGLRNLQDYLVSGATLLVPRSGQLSGVIGTAVMPYGELIGAAVSEDAIRINCPTKKSAGFLYVALSSEYGRRQLKARAFGSSIPHLDVHQIGAVIVPVPDQVEVKRISCLGVAAAELRDAAIRLESDARNLVEQAIEASP